MNQLYNAGHWQVVREHIADASVEPDVNFKKAKAEREAEQPKRS